MKGVLAFLAALLLPSVALAQLTPATLTVRGVFGQDFLATDQYGTVIVESENKTTQPIRGLLRVTVRGWRNRPVPYEVPIDLPPRAKRRNVLTVFLGSASSIDSELVAGPVIARHTLNPAYTGQDGVVVLGNPPRLRNALVDLRVMRAPDPYSGEQEVTVPVGAVELDGQTGDPILPRDAVGYNGVALFAASIGLLATCPTEEREALLDWVRGGGLLLLFPRTPGDLADPIVATTFGPIERYEDQARLQGDAADQLRVVPAPARGIFLRGSNPGVREEVFGASHRLGFGRIFLATFDGMAPGFADAAETKSLVQSILSVRRTYGAQLPLFRLGMQPDALDDSGGMYSSYGYGGSGFSSLRPALDPNEGYKPALGLVAILLIFYVFVVGPINFTFIEKRNRPILALITTPSLAIVCLVLLLGVGFVGKGTQTRYRAIEMVEAIEGDSFATSRKYSGLFFARPQSISLPVPTRGASRLLLSSGSDPGVWVDRGGRMELTEVRGRLWETAFYREDALADFGQGVTFERNGATLTAVVNRSNIRFRRAAIVDSAGNVYPLGGIEPGQRVSVPPVATDTVTPFSTNNYYYGYGSTPSPNGFERVLGLDGAGGGSLPDGLPRELGDRTKLLAGLVGRAGGSIGSDSMPTLIALADIPAGEHSSGFEREYEMRVVRVVPDLSLSQPTRTASAPANDAILEALGATGGLGDLIGAQGIGAVPGTTPDGGTP